MREIEESQSRHSFFDPPSIELAQNTFSSYSFWKTDRLQNALFRLIPRFFQTLDSISGRPSYRYGIKDYYDSSIIDLLKSEGVLENAYRGEDRFNDAPAFHRISLSANFTENVTDGIVQSKAIGHGFGKIKSEVLSKAIGEFLERYFLSIYRNKELLRGSFNHLRRNGIPALNPRLLSVFTKDQKDFRPRRNVTEDSIFNWERMERCLTMNPIFVPAQIAHWNYEFIDDEPILRDTNTNGAGGYFSKDGAILSGLYELIQRDAFLIHWFNTITPLRVDPESITNNEFRRLFFEAKKYSFEVHCLNLTLDLKVPTFAVIVTDSSGIGPSISLGASCKPNPELALLGAFEEAWSIYHWMRSRTPCNLPKNYKPFSDPSINQEKRLRLAANPTLRRHYDFLTRGKMTPLQEHKFDYPIDFPNINEELTCILKTIEANGPGYEVYSHMPQHAILSRLGYHSAQIFIPKIVPLNLREIAPPLGSGRLKEVPDKLKLKVNRNFNTFPHPFP